MKTMTYRSRIRLLVPTTCLLALAVAASGQTIFTETFDSGGFPPTGWSVVNAISGPVTWSASSDNWTGASGMAAMADSSAWPDAAYDTSLVSPFSQLPADAPLLLLRFQTYLETWSGFETVAVDVWSSGAGWSNLIDWTNANYAEGTVAANLNDFRGKDVQFRFRYAHPSASAWDLYWQVDDVTVVALELLPGDATMDGSVDLSDLSILAGNYRQSAGWTEGDFNNDGVVDVSDLSLLAGNYRRQAGLADEGQPLPEPSLLSLLAVAGGAILRRRRRR